MAYDVDKQPAEWVMHQSNRREHRLWLIGAGVVLLGGAMTAMAIGHRISVAASALLLGAVLAAKPHADRYADKHFRMLRGAVAEHDVGETLNALRIDHWIVMHDIEQDGEGNIDHLVSGPGGVFLIETKSRRYADRDLTKAKRQAAKIHDELGVFVTPVICLHTRDGDPFYSHKTWVVPRQHLVRWLKSQHNQVVEFERLARFADAL